MGIFFRKQPMPRRYNYKPVYWNQAKEEREAQMKNAACENAGNYRVKLQKGDFRRMISNADNSRKRSIRKANAGLIAALLVLLVLVYIIVNGGFWSLYF